MTQLNEIRSDVTTENIRVHSESFYISERSTPMRGLYFFGYRITVTNEGYQAARLLRRHWMISDILGHQEEVKGEGVVGEQPRILPGESYEYTSFCPLPTYRGAMVGTYTMAHDDSTEFEVAIGPFLLFVQQVLN